MFTEIFFLRISEIKVIRSYVQNGSRAPAYPVNNVIALLLSGNIFHFLSLIFVC